MVKFSQDVLSELRSLRWYSKGLSSTPVTRLKDKVKIENIKDRLFAHIKENCLYVLYCIWCHSEETFGKCDAFGAHQNHLVKQCWFEFWNSEYGVPPCLDEFLQRISQEMEISNRHKNDQDLMNYFVALTYEVRFKKHCSKEKFNHVTVWLVLNQLCEFTKKFFLQKSTVYDMKSPNPVTYVVSFDADVIGKGAQAVFANFYAANCGMTSKGVRWIKFDCNGIEPVFNLFVDVLRDGEGGINVDLSLQAADYDTLGARPANTVYNLHLHFKCVLCY